MPTVANVIPQAPEYTNPKLRRVANVSDEYSKQYMLRLEDLQAWF